MPVTVAKKKDKYRVVESSTGRIATNKSGTPVDGGGFSTADKARAQASAINASQHKRRKKKKGPG